LVLKLASFACIKDGLKAGTALLSSIQKVGKLTCWNGQVKVARRFLKVDLSEVVESKGLLQTRHDKAIMKKMVEMLELFEEATNIVQLSSISFAILCYISLLKCLSPQDSRQL